MRPPRPRAPQGLPGSGRLATIVAVALLVPLLAIPQAASQEPGDPASGPVPVAGSDRVGRGHLAQAPDGAVHLVWSSACASPTPGCSDIHHRTHDPATGAWSAVSVLRDGAQNASFPRIHHAGGDLHLLWLEGGDFYAGDPVVLHWCRLEGGACAETEALSQPALQAFEPDAAVGPDGRLRVVWQAEYHEEEDARVFFREQQSSGWGPVVSFETGGVLQRVPTVAVDDAGRAHVAWREIPPNEPLKTFQFRFAIATVEAGASTASEAEELSHAPNFRREVSLAIHDGVLHALYSTETDVYHRQRSLDGGGWSAPANVSRANSRAAGTGPVILADATGLTALWLRGSYGNYQWLASDREAGVWSRPQSLIAPPYHQLALYPEAWRGKEGGLQLLWSASLQGEDVSQMGLRIHYRVLSDDAIPYAPPSVAGTLPGHDARVRADPVPLEVSFETDRGIDEDSTRLELDGSAVPFQVGSAGIVTASVPGLEEGRHEARVVLRDAAGGEATHAWPFWVDRTAPALEFEVTDETGSQAAGWRNTSVTVRARALDDGPARVQWDVGAAGRWPELENGSMVLPEGYLADLRLRAIDAAGNVGMGPAVRVGWDATPPALHLDAPTLSRNGTVVLVFSHASNAGAQQDAHVHDDGTHHEHASGAAGAKKGPGSPVRVEATLAMGDISLNASVALQAGRLVLPDLPSGEYLLDVRAVDEAGNQATVAQDARVVVDAEPPTIHVEVLPEGRLVRFHDAVSGLQDLRVAGGNFLHEESPGGARTVEFTLPPDALLEAWATDVAGHEARWRLGPGGTEVLLQELDEAPEDPQEESEAGKQSPLGPAAVLAVLAAGLVRRRRG